MISVIPEDSINKRLIEKRSGFIKSSNKVKPVSTNCLICSNINNLKSCKFCLKIFCKDCINNNICCICERNIINKNNKVCCFM